MSPARPLASRFVLTLPGVLVLLTTLSICFAIVAIDWPLGAAALLTLPAMIYTVIHVSRATIAGITVSLSQCVLYFLHVCLAFFVVYFAALMGLAFALSISLSFLSLANAWIVICLPLSVYLVIATARRAAEEFWPEPLVERAGKPKSPIPIPRRSFSAARAATCGPPANSPQ
ncbi:MAG: hypothetical protein K1X71_12730 [Pirellulales bacterium]|nr:hypothetical protein [Pirellulales bacterium]